jgi:hypothetical protein
MSDTPRIYAAPTGRLGREPLSQVDLIPVPDEERAKRAAEQRKRELIDAGRKGFDITMPSDFDWDTFPPWVVRLADQTIWKREAGSPPDGYLPSTHCVVVTDGGAWYYLTAATATGHDAPGRSPSSRNARSGRRVRSPSGKRNRRKRLRLGRRPPSR